MQRVAAMLNAVEEAASTPPIRDVKTIRSGAIALEPVDALLGSAALRKGLH